MNRTSLTLIAPLALASAALAQQFKDETAARFPVQAEYSNQCTIVDIDGDGWLDIIWANGQSYSTQGAALKPRIYHNDGTGHFVDETDARAPGVTGWFRGVEAGDVNGDGFPDIILAQDFNHQPILLMNDGTGHFTNESAARLPAGGLSSSRAQFGDVNNDGYLDIIVCNSGTSNRFGSGQPKLWLNDGTGHFTDVTASSLPAGSIAQQMDIIFGDVDGDFDLDVIVGTRAGAGASQSKLWINDGTGHFTNMATFPTDGTSYSWDLADIDGDGDLDGISVNGGAGSAELLIKNNNGLGTSWTNISSNISPNPAIDDNDSKFFDYDNDGNLDLIIGSLGTSERIYHNNGAGVFTQVSGLITAVSDSTLDIKIADLNNDGRLDIITAQGESGGFQNRIYINQPSGPVDTIPPKIVRTEQVVPGGSPAAHAIRVEITDSHTSDRGFFDKGVALHFSFNGCAEQVLPMKWVGNMEWRAVMPAPPAGASVAYHVTAYDWNSNLGTGNTLTFTEAGTPPIPGDLNGDGHVDGADIGLLLGHWGGSGIGDINCDGIVDGADLGLLLANFTG